MPADNFTYNPPNVVMLSVCQLPVELACDPCGTTFTSKQ